MSYLKFDKNLMINLEQSLMKEMLRTNQSGAYHLHFCGRLQHPQTARHARDTHPGDGQFVTRTAVVARLHRHTAWSGVQSPDSTATAAAYTVQTATNTYAGLTASVPRTTYRVGGVILTKEKMFISHENRILVRYTLVEAHSPTTLRFRPMLAFREANALVMANDAINAGRRRPQRSQLLPLPRLSEALHAV